MEGMEKSLVPAFVDSMAAAKRAHEKKESDAKVAAMVERAKELCAGKPVTAPYNRERRRLRLEVCCIPPTALPHSQDSPTNNMGG